MDQFETNLAAVWAQRVTLLAELLRLDVSTTRWRDDSMLAVCLAVWLAWAQASDIMDLHGFRMFSVDFMRFHGSDLGNVLPLDEDETLLL